MGFLLQLFLAIVILGLLYDALQVLVLILGSGYYFGDSAPELIDGLFLRIV